MANNCYNYIEIINVNSVEIEKIKKWLESYKDFEYLNNWVNSIVEEKYQLTPNFEAGGNPREYGARWFDFTIADETDVSITISGDSAWSPMLGMCKALSGQFQCDIQIDYEELGADIGGQYYYSCGNETINFDGDYWEYSYWNDQLEYLINELSYSIDDDEESSKERLDQFLSIKEMTDKHKIELTEFYEEAINLKHKSNDN